MQHDVLEVFRGYNPADRLEKPFELRSDFQPAGDQPKAIAALVDGLQRNERDQVLLGVTGSGKTFTMAHVIAQTQRTTLILAPNKTLAAQLYGEMKSFFPSNAVEYFVSYYDYYRPEAYVPRTNTYIEKEATINEQIERMRHSATRALLERKDVVVVASVSCIYGLGAIESYQGMAVKVQKGHDMDQLMAELTRLQYRRNDIEFKRGTFRVRGDCIDIFPAHYEDRAWRLSFFGSELEGLTEIDALTGHSMAVLEQIIVYPNSHYVTPGPTLQQAVSAIRSELKERLIELRAQDKLLEAQRLQERVTYDLESLIATGMCAGIENYSCYLTGRTLGMPPPTLFEYLPKDALLMVDESHVAVPQLRGMYLGDAARKKVLYEYGFRLPSCRHNRPLKFEEWDQMRPSTLLVSATPGPWELEHASSIVEQIIRPTGLLDPVCSVHPCEGQIDHLCAEIQEVIAQGGRVLITTLTKKMAENLSDYMMQIPFKARYMHSDVDTLERIQLIADLRKGVFDVLIGINLLREGLDIPECQLVAILDADKEGYLRSKTSLIQTMGRAARHVNGRVILYADRLTGSMQGALEETQRRRFLQNAHNVAHGIVPRSVRSPVQEIQEAQDRIEDTRPSPELYAEMLKCAEALNFERAEALRNILTQRGFL